MASMSKGNRGSLPAQTLSDHMGTVHCVDVLCTFWCYTIVCVTVNREMFAALKLGDLVCVCHGNLMVNAFDSVIFALSSIWYQDHVTSTIH